MMNYEIKRFNLFSVFKISLLIYLILGLVLGLFYGLMLMSMLSSLGNLMQDEAFSEIGQLGAIGIFFMAVVMAIFCGIGGAIMATIAAAVYNLLAGTIGGIKMELAALPPPSFQQVPPPQQAYFPPPIPTMPPPAPPVAGV